MTQPRSFSHITALVCAARHPISPLLYGLRNPPNPRLRCSRGFVFEIWFPEFYLLCGSELVLPLGRWMYIGRTPTVMAGGRIHGLKGSLPVGGKHKVPTLHGGDILLTLLVQFSVENGSAERNVALSDRIHDAILYGSYARGEQHPESDVDILLTADLSQEQILAQRRMIASVASRLSLDYDVTVSIQVVPLAQFQCYVDYLPFYQNILKEGIRYAS